MATTLSVSYTTPLPPSPPLNPLDHPVTQTQRETSQAEIIHGQPTPRTSPDRSPTQEGDGVRPSVGVDGDGRQAREGKKRGKVARLEDFQLIHTLGKGCAGRVLLVKHTPTKAIHAMKAISKRSVLTYDELAHTLTEMSILKRFAIDEPENPFVAKLHYSFTDRENFYLVMEFYPGGDLATQMERDGILGHHRTRFYAADVVAGLEDLHKHGIIVRDLKPENILLNAKGHAVLADFGLSKQFPYRGDPKPIHVVTYPGQPVLPEWAGMGMGSWRKDAGAGRLTVDRAYSFVGTSEYLSPEVIQRGEYTYAVDWWALGCIVLEGMIGRVPFRKDDDEPPLVLWNKILMDPWDDLFYEPRMVDKPPSYFNLDPVTMHFIDSLLQKDPMWRITEPFVKQHPYFSYIDWETVRRGEYEDPHQLQIHPMIEYNTRYFPRLCLEEPPSVDMSTHDERYSGEDSPKRTALNDNLIYAFEQAKYKRELEDFSWSRPGWNGWEDEGSALEVGRAEDGGEERNEEGMKGTPDSPKTYLGSMHSDEDRTRTGEISPRGISKVISDTSDSSLQLDIGEQAKRMPIPKSTQTSPLSVYNDLPSPRARKTSLPTLPEALPHSSPRKADHSPLHPISSDTLPASHPPQPDTLPSAQPMPINLNNRHSHIANSPRTLPEGLPGGGLSVSDMISVPSPGIGSPRIIRRHPRGPSEDPFSVPIARLSVELNGTITQLEDEEWEQLDVEDIGEAQNGYGEQGHSGSSKFFSRGFSVLRRRPSTIGISSLRRQTKGSDSSRGESPTKRGGLMIPPTPTPQSQGGLFAGRSMENTKKAFGKWKSFPRSKKDPSIPLIAPLLPPSESKPMPPPKPPLPHSLITPNLQVKLDTEDLGDLKRPTSNPGSKLSRSRSFFTRRSAPGDGDQSVSPQADEKKVKKKKSMRKKDQVKVKSKSKSESSSTSGSSAVGMSGSVSSIDPPRVELTETSPVVWEYGEGLL